MIRKDDNVQLDEISEEGLVSEDGVVPGGVTDVSPDRDEFLADVLAGLKNPQKSVPAKYLYDRKGSRLFDRICGLDEYYPTRTEIEIMQDYVHEMADVLGRGCVIVEYGSGSSTKTPILLDALESPAAYVPVDICMEHLTEAAEELSRDYPGIAVHPICADFTQDFDVPSFAPHERRRVAYFPGSTIGNFPPAKAVACLQSMADLVGPGGGVLIGVDLKKDPAILEPAYDDCEGVTRDFTMNLLTRMNRELGSDFRPDAFRFKSFWNETDGRIEMHIESCCEQTVRINGCVTSFKESETIHTESSHKFSLSQFAEIAASANLNVDRVWSDDKNLFSVQYLTVVNGSC